MTIDYFPIVIKNGSIVVPCYGTINSNKKKRGYDKKETLHGKVIITYLNKGVFTTINITYIEKEDLIKLEKMWIDSTAVEVVSEDGEIFYGEIVDEEFNFNKTPNSVEGLYYYSGTINLEV